MQPTVPSPIPSDCASYVEPFDLEYELSRGFAASYIRRVARALAQQVGSSLCEPSDVRQELTLLLWQSLPSFNPAQGCFNAFVKLVVLRDAAHLKRKYLAAKHDRQDERSLSMLVAGPEEQLTTLAQTIGERELQSRTGATSRDVMADVERRADVAALLRSLPLELRSLACALMEESPAVVGRRRRLSRTTIYKLMRKIRNHFVAADFGPNPQTKAEHLAPATGIYPDRGPSQHTTQRRPMCRSLETPSCSIAPRSRSRPTNSTGRPGKTMATRSAN